MAVALVEVSALRLSRRRPYAKKESRLAAAELRISRYRPFSFSTTSRGPPGNFGKAARGDHHAMKPAAVYVLVFLITASAVELFSVPPPARKRLGRYRAIVVERFTMAKDGTTEECPAHLEAALQKDIVTKLRQMKLFEEVIDKAGSTTGGVGESIPPAAPSDRKDEVVLNGDVIYCSKGSRRGRAIVAMGVGAAKVRSRFVFRDAETGDQVYLTERWESFQGNLSLSGGSTEYALGKAARRVVDRLLKDIAANR